MRERTFFADIQPIISADFSAIQRRFELFRSINSNDNYYSRFRPFAKWSIILATLIPAFFSSSRFLISIIANQPTRLGER